MKNQPVNAERVLQRMLAAGGEAALHAEIAMHAIALDDTYAVIAARDARIAELEQQLVERDEGPPAAAKPRAARKSAAAAR